MGGKRDPVKHVFFLIKKLTGAVFHPQTPDGELKTRCLFYLLPVGQTLSAA